MRLRCDRPYKGWGCLGSHSFFSVTLSQIRLRQIVEVTTTECNIPKVIGRLHMKYLRRPRLVNALRGIEMFWTDRPQIPQWKFASTAEVGMQEIGNSESTCFSWTSLEENPQIKLWYKRLVSLLTALFFGTRWKRQSEADGLRCLG